MATQYTEFPSPPVPRVFSWTGIFAGTFLFLAIEATFGILGVAIFTSASTPTAPNTIGFGITAGVGIWMVILSIIALYFGGKLAGRLTGATTRNMGMYAGLVTFGMCIFSTVLITALMLGSTVGATTGIGYASPTRVADILATGGYWLFVALVLAMFSAAMGGIHGAQRGLVVTSSTRSNPEERRAA